MRARLYLVGIAVASLGASAALAENISGFSLKPIEGGGFIIERDIAPEALKSAHGLATVADLVPLLMNDTAAPEKVDFAAGKKLEGVFTVVVGREDGTLGKYEGASDVVIFAAPASLMTRGDLTTLAGAVVFALKIDNAGVPAAVQRFETGAITLTRVRASL